MVKVFLYFFKHRWVGIILLSLLLFFSYKQLGNIKIRMGIANLTQVKADPAEQWMRLTNGVITPIKQHEFQLDSDKYYTIIFRLSAKEGGILSSNYLRSLHSLSKKIQATFPDAKLKSILTQTLPILEQEEVDSDIKALIRSFTRPSALFDIRITERKLITKPEHTPVEKDELQKLIQQTSYLTPNLIDPNMQVSSLIVRLKANKVKSYKNAEYYDKLVSLVQHYSNHFKKITFISRLSYLHAEWSHLRDDMPRIILLMISFLSLLAGLLTRRWYFGLFIVLLSAINLLLMCAVLGITKISFTSLCLILPILVVVVGSTEAIHLFCSYTRGLRRHQGLCARSVIFMIKDVGKACIMTGLTTALGLFSFYLSGSPAFKDFAVIGGAAMLISGVTTLFFIPLFLSFLSHKQQHIQQSNSFFVRWFVWLKNLTMNLLRVNTKFLYGLLLVITVAALFCSVFKFNVDEEARNIFVDTHPLIQQQKDFTKDFGGYGYMTVSISPLSNADFFAPSTLLAVDQLRVELPKLGYVSSVSTYTSVLLSLLNQYHDESHTKMVSFSDFLNSNHDFLRFVSKQFSDKYFFSDNQVQLLIRYEPGSYQQMKLFQQKVLSTVLRVMGSKYKVRSDFRLMRHYLVKTNILSEGLMSLGVCLLVLFLLFVAYYHSLKVGVLAMCPSILTMIALCGLLCALGWPFTVSSVSAAIIVLTVGIDFTIHLFIKHRHLSEYMKDSSDVFKELFSRLLAPLAISAVCVSAPLLFCLFSSFIPLVRLAVLISSGVLLALVINVLVCAVIFKKISPKTLYR